MRKTVAGTIVHVLELFHIMLMLLILSLLLVHSCSYKFRAYIESTDCFGVVFYATYPVLLERAITSREKGLNRLSSVRVMKYKSPARLGDTLSFTCNPTGSVSCTREDGSEVFSATKAVHFHQSAHVVASPKLDLPYKLHRSDWRMYPDELQAYGDAVLLPTRTAFNLFERGRTDILGGPTALAASAGQALHVYVARISDYEFLCDPPSRDSRAQLSVLSHSIPLGDAMVDFFQQIVETVPGQPLEQSRLLCRARVTCCAVDQTTGLPSAFPETTRQLFV